MVPRSGGHSYAGCSTVQGLVIHAGLMRNVEYNEADQLLVVEGGALNGDIFNVLKRDNVNRSIVHGRCAREQQRHREEICRKQAEIGVDIINDGEFGKTTRGPIGFVDLEHLAASLFDLRPCWGSWHGPHATDLPLRNIVDVLLKVRVGAYSIEAGNVRHEHEWKVWRDVKLPDGKVMVPGVVSHATNVVEHPESSPTASSTSPGWSGARTSSPAPIVALAAGFTRNSFGRSSQRLSRAPSLRQRSYTGS
jgi:hypothetical protein